MNPLPCLALVGLLCGQAAPRVPMVSYPELGKLVRAEKGKVVLVYLWANYCGPCKAKGLPYLASLHNKYAKDGLEVLAVAVDDDVTKSDAARAATRTQVEAFVAAKNLPFRCVHLDMPGGKWPAALALGDCVPRCFVFGRDNRFVLRMPDLDERGTQIRDFSYDDIETAITEALKR